MIDDNKIEAAKEEIYEDILLLNGEEIVFNNDEKEEMFYKEDIKEAIGLGAKWGINELLKDLWHPVSEEPRKDVSIIVETHNDKNMFYYAWNRWQDNFYPSWTDAVLCSRVYRWLYIDDLLPKKEVSNERA